jgi:hypothetical protein
MPTLRDLQSAVLHAVLDGTQASAVGPALALLADRDARANARLRVYRNNAWANFHDSLESTYPVIARLVGDAYFRQLARGLQQRHPSRSGDLLWVGRNLPAYLAALHPDGEFQYLPDVARFEWLVQEALLAASHQPLARAKLAAAAEHHDTLVFVPHPTVRFFESRFPVLRVWDSNVSHEDSERAHIDLASGADRVLLLRPRLTLECHRLDSGECRLLRGLLAGERFAASIEESTQSDACFDATAALQRFVAMGAIVDCRW